MSINRKDFLKIGCSTLAAAVAGQAIRSVADAAGVNSAAYGNYPPGGNLYQNNPVNNLGRTTRSMDYHEQPSFVSPSYGFYNTDEIVHIQELQVGESEMEHNPIWYRTEDGWIHSSYVQPVRNDINTPVLNIPDGGMLAEVSVPYTDAWQITATKRRRAYRYYYGSTHWVIDSFPTDNGFHWYRVLDDRNMGTFIVQADHLRQISEHELQPISDHIEQKHLEVDLATQKINAYENGKHVFTARIASGYFPGDTPDGEFTVERKTPSRHMAARTETTEFDLPGVPWVCYISWTGVSIHGTYWHNNYGTPQSHGCINLSPEAAKWVYRWTDPYVPYNVDYELSENGTKVVVH
jgi:lipoprotein-anchoring transpeptidase ErfK/SrfK